MEEVILVDPQDRETGKMEKIEAHEKGILHRAFSIFIFNPKKEMLLQRRAYSKYHSAGLWTNACCSHPRPGETTIAAANRRLREEMGLECKLTFKTTFLYKSAFGNGLTEHELDHVFVGESMENPVLNKYEVAEYKWATTAEIKNEIKKEPDQFTTWFRIAMENIF